MKDFRPFVNLSHRHPGLWWLLPGGLLYFFCAKLGMALFSLTPSNIALLWLPSGVGMVMCLSAGGRAVPVVMLSSMAANYAGMAVEHTLRSLAHVVVSGGADALAAYLAASMMRRQLPQGLNKLYDLFPFCLYVCLLPTLASAVVLATNLAAGDYIPWLSVPTYMGMLVIADSLGILIVFPLSEAWRDRRALLLTEWSRWAMLSISALMMVYFAFAYVSGLIFMVIPVLLYLAFHGRAYGVLLTLALAVCLIVTLAARDFGPFQVTDARQAHFMLIAYLFSITLIVLGMVLQQRELTEEKRSRQRWQFRAQHDPLTGLSNRGRFMPLLTEEFERAQRMNRVFSVAVIDLDFFKAVNDNYGHASGDEVLMRFAEQLQKMLRSTDVPARIGGEEFAVLFVETPLEYAHQAMERIRLAICNTPIVIGLQRLSLTISVGIAEYHTGSEFASGEAVLNKADKGLYLAKRDGRNRVVVIESRRGDS